VAVAIAVVVVMVVAVVVAIETAGNLQNPSSLEGFFV
jgi:hypothetical protein